MRVKNRLRVLFLAFVGVCFILIVASAIVLLSRGSNSSDEKRQAIAISEIEERGGLVEGKRNINGTLLVWHITLPEKPSRGTIECLKMFPHLKSVTIRGEQLPSEVEAQLRDELGGVIVESFVPVPIQSGNEEGLR